MAIADLIMPKMGESIMEATILKWHKKVGDHVKLDETVLDIATDKVDSEIPSPVEGIIAEILYPVNNVVPVGSVIAKIQTDINVHSGAPTIHPIVSTPVAEVPVIHTIEHKFEAPITPEPVFSQPIIQHTQEPAHMESTHHIQEENIPFQPFTTAPKTGNNRFFSPLVLNIANSEGINLSELERIPGTGADGRVSKKDVLQYIADKRAGKVAAFVPQQAPPQVVYAPQPPVQEYYQPIVEAAPVQPIVQNRVADTPVYIAPQPIVEPVFVPQPIVEAPIHHTYQEPVIYPQPIQENIVHEQSVESVIQPIVEPAQQPIVETVTPPIVEPIVQPVYQHQPVVEPYYQPTIESIQPIVEPIPQPNVEVAPVQPIVEPVYQPIVEPVQPLVQAFVAPIPEPIVEKFIPATPIVEEVIAPQPTVQEYVPQAVFVPTPIVEPVYQQAVVEQFVAPEPLVAHVASPVVDVKEEVIAPVQQEVKAQAAPVVQESIQLKPVPVYMIPATTPTVPLVTLAEGDSGKYTTPDSALPSGNVEIIEMDRMRKLISKHMVESKQISAHVTSFTEADVTNMVLWRERVKNDFERREGTKLTFTPMFIDCIVKVLKRYPLLNASVEGDKIIIKKDLNIGMATALPTGNLIVPVIKGADQLNIVGLSAAVNKLATSARANQLKPDDITGGTFTFTNVGTFGTLMGTPIINQPQVAILAVGIIKKRPVVIESPNNDTIGIRHMMYLSLSYDHRVIDGSVGSSFLADVAKEMEAWDLNRTWYHYL